MVLKKLMCIFIALRLNLVFYIKQSLSENLPNYLHILMSQIYNIYLAIFLALYASRPFFLSMCSITGSLPLKRR